MFHWRDLIHESREKFNHHVRGPFRTVFALAVLLLAAGIVFWLSSAGFLTPAKPLPAQPPESPFDRLVREQRAKENAYVKPTVTAAMGDLGGKYFGQPPDPAKTRHYYIAAEPEQWDFMPDGSDPVCGLPLPVPVLAKHISGKFRYFQYTDATFTKRVPQPSRLGILGPVLRGVVGQYLEITFLNRAPGWIFSMHPHGVKYDKDSEGSYHSDTADQLSARQNTTARASPFQGLGAAVASGARFTYVWYLDESSGPLPSEPSSKAWLYHSHVRPENDLNLGLEGFIIVTDPRRARPDGTPNDVDREMAALFMIYDESGVRELIEDQAGVASFGDEWNRLQKAYEDGERHAINGRIFGNLSGLDMNEGERVRWYLFGLGSEKDFHTAHWHGLRVLEDGRRRTDVVELLPATMKIADMLADNPGQWLFHCHVEEHMANGMFARVTVYPKGAPGVSRDPAKAFFGLPLLQN